jgi:predicted phage terminase large subunit-like protein
MECQLVAAEQLAFRPAWLRYYEELPEAMTCVLAIDPVPPPSDAQIAKRRKTSDYEAIAVVGRARGDYYLVDYLLNRDHDPNWTTAKMFELGIRYKVRQVIVETVAYQRVLKWILEKAMARKGVYFPVRDTKADRRPKYERIISTLSGPASQGHFWCRKEHHDFILQFQSYGRGYRGHDDLLDAVVLGLAELTSPYLELAASEYYERFDLDDSQIPAMAFRPACP